MTSKNPFYQLIKLFIIISAFAIGAASLYFMATFFGFAIPRLLNNAPNSGIEIQPVWAAMQIAKDQPLYHDYINSETHIPLTYGILTYIVPGLIAKAFHYTDFATIALVGRIFVFSGFLLVLVMTYLVAKTYTNDTRIAFLAIVPVWWFPYINEWATKLLPDYGAIGLSLLGWYLLKNNSKYELSWLRCIMAAIFWLAAWHLKPIILLGPVAYLCETFYAYFQEKNIKKLFVSWKPLYIYTGLALGSAFLLSSLTHGLWYLNSVKSANDFRWDYNFVFLTFPFSPSMIVIPLLLIYGVLSLKDSPVALALIFEVLLSGIFQMKEGSNINYLTSGILLSGICLALTVKNYILNPINNRLIICLIIFISVGFTALAINLKETNRFSSEYFYTVDNQTFKNVDSVIAEIPKNKILCLSPFYAMTHNLPVYFTDYFHYAVLIKNQIINSESLKMAILNRDFSFIITEKLEFEYHNVLPVQYQLANEIRSNYTPIEIDGPLQLWKSNNL